MDEQKIDELFKSFVEGYKEKASLYNYGEHEKEAFPLLKFEEWLNYTCIEIPKEFNGSGHFLIIVDNENQLKKFYKFEISDFTNLEKEELIGSSFLDIADLILSFKFKHLMNKNILYLKHSFPKDWNMNRDIKQEGGMKAIEDANNWKKENQIPVSKQDHDKISPYSHLDYEGIVASFVSVTHHEDFEYQMQQAEECYKRKLFLPAAATLSVALETLLQDMCDKENIKIKNDTMLNALGDALYQRKVINYRMNKRIDLTYSLRNSVSHTNKGQVSKADCEIIMNTIKTLIEDYY